LKRVRDEPQIIGVLKLSIIADLVIIWTKERNIYSQRVQDLATGMREAYKNNMKRQNRYSQITDSFGVVIRLGGDKTLQVTIKTTAKKEF